MINLTLLSSQFEVLATLQSNLMLILADSAFQTQHNLLGRLSLLVEHRLSLTTKSTLLAIVTTLSLSEQRGLTGLVLRDLVRGVLSAVLALAVGVAGFWDVDLFHQYAFLGQLGRCRIHPVNGRRFARARSRKQTYHFNKLGERDFERLRF